MKQAIYVFCLYIGAVTFYTLTYFRQPAEVVAAFSLAATLATGAIVYAANRSERGRNLA